MIGIIASSKRRYDPQAEIFFTGITLTDAQKLYYNELFVTLRALNAWSTLDRLHIYAGITEEASRKSLIGNFVATNVGSPTWSKAVGFTHTGTSAINTNWTPSTHASRFALDSYCVFGSIGNLAASFGSALFFGVTSNSSARSYFAGQLGTSGAITFSSLGTQDTNVFTRTTQTDYAIRRQSNANYTGFQDGSSTTVTRTRAHDLPTLPHYDSGRNSEGSLNLPLPSGAFTRYSGNGSGSTDWPAIRTAINNWIANMP